MLSMDFIDVYQLIEYGVKHVNSSFDGMHKIIPTSKTFWHASSSFHVAYHLTILSSGWQDGYKNKNIKELKNYCTAIMEDKEEELDNAIRGGKFEDLGEL